MHGIHRHAAASFEPVDADGDGYQQSSVLGCRYRLQRGRNAKGRVVFDLQEKSV
jgi:hypothetical protein